jgi:hypothetical protein
VPNKDRHALNTIRDRYELKRSSPRAVLKTHSTLELCIINAPNLCCFGLPSLFLPASSDPLSVPRCTFCPTTSSADNAFTWQHQLHQCLQQTYLHLNLHDSSTELRNSSIFAFILIAASTTVPAVSAGIENPSLLPALIDPQPYLYPHDPHAQCR